MKINPNTKEVFRLGLAVVMVAGFFLILSFMIYTKQYNDAVLTMTGALTGCVLTVVNYEWGSSKGSAEKTELLNQKKDEDHGQL